MSIARMKRFLHAWPDEDLEQLVGDLRHDHPRLSCYPPHVRRAMLVCTLAEQQRRAAAVQHDGTLFDEPA